MEEDLRNFNASLVAWMQNINTTQMQPQTLRIRVKVEFVHIDGKRHQFNLRLHQTPKEQPKKKSDDGCFGSYNPRDELYNEESRETN